MAVVKLEVLFSAGRIDLRNGPGAIKANTSRCAGSQTR
jgi:hypothetical protein